MDHDAGLPGSLERGRKRIRSWTKNCRRVYFPPVPNPTPRPISVFESNPRHSTFQNLRSRIESPSRQVLARRRRQTPLLKVGREQRTDHHRKSPGHRAHLPSPPATSPHPKNHQQSSFLPPPPDLSNDRAQCTKYAASSYSTLPYRRNGSSAVGRPAVDAAGDEIGPDFAVYVFPSSANPAVHDQNHETQLLTLALCTVAWFAGYVATPSTPPSPLTFAARQSQSTALLGDDRRRSKVGRGWSFSDSCH